MKIFTFWHDRNSIPGYLKLCMKTHRKFIKNHELVFLDYSNLKDYTDIQSQPYWQKLLDGKFGAGLAAIVDVIRIHILAEHGGMWMDLDTIITSDDFEKNYLDFQTDKDVSCFSTSTDAVPTFGCIISKKPSEFINYAKKEQIRRIEHPTDECHRWFYFANGVFEPYFMKHKDEFNIFNSRKMYLEYQNLKQWGCGPYRKFWFEQNVQSEEIMKNQIPPVVFLHNSWTPDEIKKMDENTFLSRKSTMSNLLEHLCGVKWGN